MDWRITDKDAVIAIEFMRDGEFAIPDVGSVTLTLRGNDGAVLPGFDELPVIDNGTSTQTVTIPQAQNQIAVGAKLETRYGAISYSVDAVPHNYGFVYRLTPFLPLQQTVGGVRAFIGADSAELPDSDIDLMEAYFALEALLGVKFTEALTATSRASLIANRMLGLKAAITTLPSMQTRLRKSQTSHNEQIQKFVINFEQLKADLEKDLLDATTELTDLIDGPTTTAVTPIFQLSQPIDVITGAAAV